MTCPQTEYSETAYTSAQPPDSTAPSKHIRLTPWHVIHSLPLNATPEEQDSAIQKHFRPVIVAPSARPDTLCIPGLEAEPFGVHLDAKAYQKGFFNESPYLHPELRIIQPGVPGDPIPYLLHRDDYVTGTLLLSFFLGIGILARSRHILTQQIKDFFHPRERENLFTLGTDAEVRGQLFLIFQTCLVLGILFFNYTQHHLTDVFREVSPYKLLGIDIGLCLLFYVLKVGVYAFINWIFFDKKRNGQWMEAYFLVILGIGIALFPVALLVVYFGLPQDMVLIVVLTVLGFSKILLLYKGKQIFFSHFNGYMQLIVYFCAFEVLPSFVLWRTLVRINQSLVVII